MNNPLFTLSTAAGLAPEQPAARKAEKLAALRERILRQARMAIIQYDRANRAGIEAVNNDPDFSPAEGWAALGPDAARILQGSAAATLHVADIAGLAGSDYVPPSLPAGITLTPNKDGTVSVVPEAVE